MITKFNLPKERLNISVHDAGVERIKELLGIADGLVEALEIDHREAITINTHTNLVELHMTDVSGEVRQWRQRLYEVSRRGIVKALTELDRNNNPSMVTDMVYLRARRDSKIPPAWQYRAQPLVKRLIAASGHEPGAYLKACGLKEGAVHSFATKPKGQVTRTIKLPTAIPFIGDMKQDKLVLRYAELAPGYTLNWVNGISPQYAIQMQAALPESVRDSLIGQKAADLVDDPRVKQMFGEMTIERFGQQGTQGNGHQMLLSTEDDEMMEELPDHVEELELRLCNRLADWAGL